jgi:hypothetical protein
MGSGTESILLNSVGDGNRKILLDIDSILQVLLVLVAIFSTAVFQVFITLRGGLETSSNKLYFLTISAIIFPYIIILAWFFSKVLPYRRLRAILQACSWSWIAFALTLYPILVLGLVIRMIIFEQLFLLFLVTVASMMLYVMVLRMIGPRIAEREKVNARLVHISIVFWLSVALFICLVSLQL